MLILLSLILLQAAPAPGGQSVPAPGGQAAAPAAQSGLYIVGPNDVLTVTVFNQPQLSGKFSIEADGTLAFPLIGRVKVGGLSVRAVEDELRAKLANGFLTNPNINVAVEQYRSQQIFVMGEVKQPGPLQFTGAMTLIEALARVGSPTEKAGTEVMVVRPPGEARATATLPTGNPSSETIRVDLQSLQTGELSQNISLRAGDTIFVPRAATVFVSGQVKTPGEYVIRGRMTVRQALALAGGVTDRGSTRRIQIVRQADGKEATMNADLQTPVQAGDTIVVRERLM
jgi:polysaccharide export outer membrane protein